MRGVVDRDPVEQLVQEPTLQRLQPRLRPLDHARRAGLPRQSCVAVVAQALVVDHPLEPAHVGEPLQLADVERQPRRQVADRVDPRHRPARPHRLRVKDRLAQHPRRHPRAPRQLLEHDLDVGRELARTVERRAVVGLAGPRGRPSPATPGVRAPAAPGPPSRPGLPLTREERGGEDASGLARDSARATTLPDGSRRACARVHGTAAAAHAMHCSGHCVLPREALETHLRGAGSGGHRRGADHTRSRARGRHHPLRGEPDPARCSRATSRTRSRRRTRASGATAGRSASKAARSKRRRARQAPVPALRGRAD